jgi:hypothetical protein
MTYYITTLQLPPYCALPLCSKVYMYVRLDLHIHTRDILLYASRSQGAISSLFFFFSPYGVWMVPGFDVCSAFPMSSVSGMRECQGLHRAHMNARRTKYQAYFFFFFFFFLLMMGCGGG